MEKDQLQEMAAEHKSACEKVEHDLQTLQGEYADLIKELDEKQDEIDSYQRQLDSGGDGGEFQNLKAEIKDLQSEIEQVEVEKAELEDRIKILERDAAQLIEKDGKVSKDRSDERKLLQNV
jgi:chromosome segregation ATPase